MRLILSLLLICVSLSTAIAGPLEDGTAAYARGDYAIALRLLRLLAEQGDPRAQLYLGRVFATG